MSIRGIQLVFYEGSGLDNAIGSNFDSRYDGRTCAHKAALADGNISTYGSPEPGVRADPERYHGQLQSGC